MLSPNAFHRWECFYCLPIVKTRQTFEQRSLFRDERKLLTIVNISIITRRFWEYFVFVKERKSKKLDEPIHLIASYESSHKIAALLVGKPTRCYQPCLLDCLCTNLESVSVIRCSLTHVLCSYWTACFSISVRINNVSTVDFHCRYLLIAIGSNCGFWQKGYRKTP